MFPVRWKLLTFNFDQASDALQSANRQPPAISHWKTLKKETNGVHWSGTDNSAKVAT